MPSDRKAKNFKERVAEQLQYPIFSARDLESSKRKFVKAPQGVAVVANRYDGIDLPDEECRLLIVEGIPSGESLQERFISVRLGASILLKERLRTRITQAFGRCTRSATDYSAVVVRGTQLNRFLLQESNQKLFSQDLQAEMQFGIEQSTGVNEEGFLENLSIFLDHGDLWDTADDDIVARRSDIAQPDLPARTKLEEAVKHEVGYQYSLVKMDFAGAVQKAQLALSFLSGDNLRGYRGLWYYLAGSAAEAAAASGSVEMAGVARRLFERATAAVDIKWFASLAENVANPEKAGGMSQSTLTLSLIEGLETQFERIGNSRRLEAKLKVILEGLNDVDAKRFEAAHLELGRLLGFEAANSSANAGPDPYWLVENSFCLVFEDHTNKKEPVGALGANKVRQAASHPDWIASNLSLCADSTVVPVLVTPCTLIETGALPHAKELLLWPLEDFREFARAAIVTIRKLFTSFQEPGDLAWRASACQVYEDENLTPQKLSELLRKNLVKNMPTEPR